MVTFITLALVGGIIILTWIGLPTRREIEKLKNEIYELHKDIPQVEFEITCAEAELHKFEREDKT